MQEIWQFGDLERKAGRIGVIYEIIKGVMRIGKIGEIREFLNADYLNSIKNIFLALSLFFAREMKE